MKLIPLTQGQVAKIDDADFAWLNQWKWYAVKSKGGKFYAARQERICPKRQRTVFMHRVILGLSGVLEGDHKNGDSLNNQRWNLRVATSKQNVRNRKIPFTNSSGYKGVYLFKPIQKWHARIGVNHKRIHLGYFNSAKTAARAYDLAARTYFGEFAKTNFAT